MRAVWLFLALFSGIVFADDHVNKDEVVEFNGCVEIEVDGVRSPSFSCLTRKLLPATKQRQFPGAELEGSNITRRSGNQLGLFNQAATSHRMGNTFGTSVRPQRPDNAPISPLIPPR